MAGELYVRKAGGAGGAGVDVPDLGFTVASGASWTELTAGDEQSALGSTGNFTARELRDSQDLYDLIIAGTLDWSKDGSTTEVNADYTADYAVVSAFVDDDLDLSDGSLTMPQGPSNPGSLPVGSVFYNQTDNTLYLSTSGGLEAFEMGSPKTTLLLDEVGAYTYVGEATPGTATTVSGWRIYRLDETASGAEELLKLWANNSTDFDQVWDDRLTLTYSV